MHCTSEVAVIGDQGILQTGIWGERLLFKSIKDSGTRPLGTALPSTPRASLFSGPLPKFFDGELRQAEVVKL